MESNADLTIELPHAPDAEAALLSLMVEHPKAIANKVVEGGITHEFFYDRAHAELFQILLKRIQSGKPVDPSSIKEDIRHYKVEKLTVPRLGDILSQDRDEGGVDGYLSALRQTRAKRLVIEATQGADHLSGHDVVAAVRRASETATAALSGLSEIHDAKGAVQRFLQELNARQEAEGAAGLSTGIPAIDNHCGGMRPRELWVVGAKTSHGKSILMLQMAANAIMSGKKVLLFTLELGADEIVARLISNQYHISMQHIMSPRTMTKQQMAACVTKIREGCEQIEQSQLHICDTADLSIDQITSHAVSMHDLQGVDLVLIDYLQMIGVPRVKGQNREQEVAKISRACKQLAKRINKPVLTATQLNSEGQARESRAVEHDADNVLLIDGPDDDVTITFWKCRNGQRGHEIKCTRHGEYQKFEF